MPDFSKEIAALEEILNAGASSISTDGEQVSFDLSEVRRRLAELRRVDDGELAAGRHRPTNATVRLDYF